MNVTLSGGSYRRVIHYVWPHNITHLNRQLNFIFRNYDEAHKIPLMALVIPCFQASTAVFTKVLVPGGLVQSIHIRKLFQASKCGKRGNMRRDQITALYFGNPGWQSCSKICREMEPEWPADVLVPASVMHLLCILWAWCNLEVLCSSFSTSKPISRCLGEQTMKHSQLLPGCWGAMLSVVLSGRVHGAAVGVRKPH